MSTTLGDCRLRISALALTAFSVGMCGVPARAEGVYGSFQTQYQKIDERALFVRGDNTTRTQEISQELWLRTLDLHQQSYLRPNLLLESNVRYSDRSLLDRADLSRTPMGVMRLIHPYVQLMASHQPAYTRSSLASLSGLNRDSVTSRTVTARTNESMAAGHFALPRLPRVDLAWVERRRDGAGSTGDRNQTRSARLTFDRDRYSGYGTVNQQRIWSGTPGAGTNIQTVLAGGGTYRYAPRPTMSLSTQYDLSDVLGASSGRRRPSIFSQSASVNGDWRPQPKWVNSTSYQWRRVDYGTANLPTQADQEGTLMSRYLFARRSSVLSGFGFRTVRAANAGGEGDGGVQRYGMALATIDVPVRRKWTMASSLSHTTNWDPGRGPFSVETISASTRGAIRQTILADVNFQVSANGDTASAGSRFASAWAARIQGAPLRTLQLVLSLRSMRNGPGLLRPFAVARGMAMDMNWRPMATLQVIGQYGVSSAAPGASSRSTTRTATVRYEPTARWQWYGSWTRSDQRVFVSSAGQLSTREVLTTRVQYAPTRRLAASAALSQNDPGRAQESRRYDLTLAWSFGR